MTALSVNLNKIALLRNSRGRDYPNVLHYARWLIDLGVAGITVHPRQDERHIKRQDTVELATLLKDYPGVEFNVEGFPTDDFLELIEITVPDQCTLVPDATDQLTSDHGWQVSESRVLLDKALQQIHDAGVRAALFLDPDLDQVEAAASAGYDRIELYTEGYARSEVGDGRQRTLDQYAAAVTRATELGLGVNAGHDLDLGNLRQFLSIGNVLEVSIGHALTVESIERSLPVVVGEYLEICETAP